MAPPLDGSISKGFGSLKRLEILCLGVNNLIGNIPPIISNLSMLQWFDAGENNIKGSDLWRLQNLNILDIHLNNLTGTIPQNIFNITSLQILNLMGNSLSGNLSLDTRIPCPNLGRLFLGGNYISGRIPSYLSNCSNLISVDLSGNFLSGPIPRSLGNLKYLKILALADNQLTEESGHQEHSFLTSLTNCTSLEMLAISFNPLNIALPEAIGNFSDSLNTLSASQCQIKGQIPMGIGSLKNLNLLDLRYNNVFGNLPSTLGGLEELQRLYLSDNNIGGNIPEELCQQIGRAHV